jgi:hypothetical protein
MVCKGRVRAQFSGRAEVRSRAGVNTPLELRGPCHGGGYSRFCLRNVSCGFCR